MLLRLRSILSCGIVCFLGVSLSGCGTAGYIFSVVGGELDLLASTVPIEDGLNDPSLTDDQRAKLGFVVRARDYAEQVVGMNVNTSFRNFANLGQDPLSWNLTASKKDALEPFIWSLPFAGSIPYIGFFDFDDAVAVRDQLINFGYDTFVYKVDAYSTLGLLPDPVASPLLERDYFLLADTVMHELTHNTIFVNGETNFSESLATFVGQTAGIEFLQFEFGQDSDMVQQAREYYEDSERLNSFLRELIEELTELYAQDLSLEEKIAARKPIFESARDRFTNEVMSLMNNPARYQFYADTLLNNAFLLVNVRYHDDLEVYQGIFEMAGRVWGQALDLFSQAAAADNPVEYLRALLAENNAGL